MMYISYRLIISMFVKFDTDRRLSGNIYTVLSYQGFDQIFRQLLDDLSEKCYLCHEGG